MGDVSKRKRLGRGGEDGPPSDENGSIASVVVCGGSCGGRVLRGVEDSRPFTEGKGRQAQSLAHPQRGEKKIHDSAKFPLWALWTKKFHS